MELIQVYGQLTSSRDDKNERYVREREMNDQRVNKQKPERTQQKWAAEKIRTVITSLSCGLMPLYVFLFHSADP